MKVKRLLMMLALVCLLAGALTVTTFARDPGASGQIGPDARYTLSSEGVLTISGTGSTYSYYPTGNSFSPFWGASIKSVIIEMGITNIGDNLFQNCPDLETVTIAPGVTAIGEYAFCDCPNLTQVKLPGTVSVIGPYAFSYCPKLTTINCPKSVTSIGKWAFAGCDSLVELPGVELDGAIRWTLNKDTGVMRFTGSGDMPNFDVVNNHYPTWNYLDDYIRSVIVDEGITSIGSFSFWDCQNLEAITVAGTVTTIGKAAFECCYKLTDVQLSNGLTTIGTDAFYGCGMTAITIPESVTSVGHGAFTGTGLTDIRVPDTVTYLGSNAFFGCTGLKTAVLSKSLSYVPGGIFAGCTSLTDVEIRSEVLEAVGSYAFEGCTALEMISLPENTTGIEDSAFEDCTSLCDLRLPGGLEYISSGAFKNCTSLTSLAPPEKLRSIGYEAFRGCTGLTEVHLAEGLQELGDAAFQGCTGLTSIRLPDTVTSLGWSGTFQNCTSLETVVLSKNITQIGKSCFQDCVALTSLEIPGVLTDINDFAFYGCDALESITIDSAQCKLGIVCLPEGITVYGYEGSTAQEYAEIYELTFVSLGQPSIDRYSICLEYSEYSYSQKEIKPSVTIEGLTKDEDYTVSYKNNINAGTGTVVVTGMGSVTGTAEVEFTIAPMHINVEGRSHVTMELLVSSYPYTGQAIIPELRIYHTYFGCYLTEGVDYIVSSDSKDVGNGWVTATGIGNYTGEVERSFIITKAPLSNNSLSLEQPQYTYTGQPIEPKIIAPAHLVEGVDYNVSYYNNTYCGTATVRLWGNGCWTGSVDLTFEIVEGLETPQVTASSLYPSGKIKLTWGKIDGAAKYQIWRSAVENGKYVLAGTVPGTGYVDLHVQPGIKYYYKVVAVSEEGSGNSNPSDTVSQVAKLTRPTVRVKLNADSRPLVSWKQVSGAVKYQVYRATAQNGRYVLLKTVSGTGCVDTSARPGVTYYYKVVALGRDTEANSNPSTQAVLPTSLNRLPLYP